MLSQLKSKLNLQKKRNRKKNIRTWSGKRLKMNKSKWESAWHEFFYWCMVHFINLKWTFICCWQRVKWHSIFVKCYRFLLMNFLFFFFFFCNLFDLFALCIAFASNSLYILVCYTTIRRNARAFVFVCSVFLSIEHINYNWACHWYIYINIYIGFVKAQSFHCFTFNLIEFSSVFLSFQFPKKRPK